MAIEISLPRVPAIPLRDYSNLLPQLFYLGLETPAEGQYQGYPIVAKKAIRRAIFKRILNHDEENQSQRRALPQVITSDI